MQPRAFVFLCPLQFAQIQRMIEGMQTFRIYLCRAAASGAVFVAVNGTEAVIEMGIGDVRELCVYTDIEGHRELTAVFVTFEGFAKVS